MISTLHSRLYIFTVPSHTSGLVMFSKKMFLSFFLDQRCGVNRALRLELIVLICWCSFTFNPFIIFYEQYGVNLKHQEYFADSPSTGMDPATREEWIFLVFFCVLASKVSCLVSILMYKCWIEYILLICWFSSVMHCIRRHSAVCPFSVVEYTSFYWLEFVFDSMFLTDCQICFVGVT